MSSKIETHSSCNITLVYDVLPLAQIDRNALRQIVDEPDVVTIDAPEILVVISALSKVHLRLGNRRVRVTDQNNRPPGESPIPSMVSQVHQLATASKLAAYGFNYDVTVLDEEGRRARQLVKDRFLRDEEGLAQLLEGEIVWTVPRYIFDRGQARYDLILEPRDGPQVVAHLNVHFELAAQLTVEGLPPEEDLRGQFVEEYDWFSTLLGRLLKESDNGPRKPAS